jgi:hypothetical protein
MIRVTRFRFACSSGRAFSTSSSDAPSSSSSSLLSVDGVAGRVLGAAGGALRVSAHLGGAAAQLGGAATRAALRESSALLLAVAPEAKVAVPAPLLSSLAAARFLAELGSEAVQVSFVVLVVVVFCCFLLFFFVIPALQGVAAASALAARGVGSAAAQILRDSFGDSTGNAFPSASAQISGMVRDAEKLVDVLVKFGLF